MSQLEEDLAKDWESVKGNLQKGDILEGLLILIGMGGELAALLGLVFAAFTGTIYLTGGLAALGLPFLVGPIQTACIKAAQQILNQYTNLSSHKRKAVVSALQFLGVPISIFHSLL